jgi:hypothetical protein
MSKAQELQARVTFLTARATALHHQTLAAIEVAETQKSAAVSARILIAAEQLLKGMGEFVMIARYYEGVVPSGIKRIMVLAAADMYTKDATDFVAPAYVEFLAPLVESLLNQAEAALAAPAASQPFGDAEGAALDLAYLLRTKGMRAAAAYGEKFENFDGEEGHRVGLALSLMDDAVKIANECDSLGAESPTGDPLAMIAEMIMGNTEKSPLKQALEKVDAETLVSIALPASLKVVTPVLEQIYTKVVELVPELKLC